MRTATMLASACLLCGMAGISVPAAHAQTTAAKPPPRRLSPREIRVRDDSMRLSTTLDVWIVERFRGAQLLADIVPPTRSVAADVLWPRIESMRAGGRNDTLFALHFDARARAPSLASTGAVRLAGPTGTVSPIAANVLARRPFRAPRAPRASNGNERDWRYGWAYLVALPRAGRTASATTFRGWLLIDTVTPK